MCGVDVINLNELSANNLSKQGLCSNFVNSYEVLIGNREWLKLNNVPILEEVEAKMIKEEECGNIITLCAVNGTHQISLKLHLYHSRLISRNFGSSCFHFGQDQA